MELFQTFKRFCTDQDLLHPGQRILLAVSGGIDSMVMAALFLRWLDENPTLFQLGIAHMNFRLRGEESDTDERFVQQFAGEYQLPCLIKGVDTTAFAEEKRISIQMAARMLRYDWFEQLCLEHQYDCVATAHNQNDNLETFLLHFTRGTGLAGLTGIPVRVKHIIRPLVFASRSEIRQFALENGISWREDSSNDKDEYARNFLRHHVVPLLEQLNPSVLKGSERTMHRLKGVWDNYRTFIDQLQRQHLHAEGSSVFRLDKAALDTFPDKTSLLLEILQRFDVDEEQARQIADNWGQSGLEWTTRSGWRILNDRNNLLLSTESAAAEVSVRIEADDLMVSLPEGGRLVFMPAQVSGPYPDGREAILADRSKLQFPLLLRRWNAGDVFYPLGMEGKKQKLQDFFVNQKLSRLEKEKVWVLENGDGAVIWIPGYRPDERFKITGTSVEALKISRVD